MSAALGVSPPSDRPAHSSTRAAPASAATRAPATDSTLISTRMSTSIQRDAGHIEFENLRGGPVV